MSGTGTNAYTAWDSTEAASRVQGVLAQLPLDSQSFNQASDTTYRSVVNAAKTDSETAQRQAGKEMTAKFITTTDVMAQMNEAANANMYIADILDTEYSRVANLDSSAKNGIYRTRQEFMYNNFMREYYRFVTKILVYTLVLTLFLLSIVALWRLDKIATMIMIVIVVLTLAVYAVSLVLMFKQNALRRNYMWNKFYWKASDSIRNESVLADAANNLGSCPTS